MVKYDTIIELPSDTGLKPGMSAEVDVILAVHEDVLTIPVAAVVETEEGSFCWVQPANKEVDGPQKRILELGDSNDIFIEVVAGLNEGEEVILNPIAMIDEAEQDAKSTLSQTQQPEEAQNESETDEDS